jgi:hypothetical protein
MTSQRIRLGGPQTPDGIMVGVFRADGSSAQSLPAGTMLPYEKLTGSGQDLRYEIVANGQTFYVKYADAVAETQSAASAIAERRSLPGVPTATPIQLIYVVLGTKGAGPGERVPIYLENKPTAREIGVKDAGTKLQMIEETQIMYKVLLPTGELGYVLKGSASRAQ